MGMKKQPHFILLLLCFFFAAIPGSFAQDSREVFEIHTTVKGETLSAIAKKYALTLEEIRADNPGIKKNIKAGQKIKIRIHAPAKENASKNIGGSGKYLLHKVRKGETLYAISRTYSVSVQEIQYLNPGAEKGIKEGEELRVPSGKEHVAPAKESAPDTIAPSVGTHKVLPGETLYSISKRYGVSIQSLLDSNPELIVGLKAGQVIKIRSQAGKTLPVSPDTTIKQSQSAKETDHPFAASEKDSSKEKSFLSIWKKNKARQPVSRPDSSREESRVTAKSSADTTAKKNEYNVAIFLPFHLGDAPEPSDSSGEEGPHINSESLPALEFYQGVTLAADSLAKSGLSAHLYVYDTRGDSSYVKQLLQGGDMQKADAVIGSLTQNDLLPLARFAKEKKIPILSPVTTSFNIAYNNPMAEMASPSVKTQCEEMARFMGEKYKKSNYILLNNNLPREIEISSIFKNKLAIDGLSAREINIPKQGISFFKINIMPSVKNVIFVCSSNEAFVTEVLTELNARKDSNIIVAGLPTWENFETVDLEFFQKLQVHIFSSSYIEYEDPATRKFSSVYRSQYKTEPSLFAFQGFDMTLYFLNALMNFGSRLNDNISYVPQKGLSLGFDFYRTGQQSGCENRSIAVFMYRDYQKIRLK